MTAVHYIIIIFCPYGDLGYYKKKKEKSFNIKLFINANFVFLLQG